MLRYGIFTSRPIALTVTCDGDGFGSSLKAPDPVTDATFLQLLRQDAICTRLDSKIDESLSVPGNNPPSQPDSRSSPLPSITDGAETVVEGAFRAGLEASDAFDIASSAKR
jgi:hypothetical protein